MQKDLQLMLECRKEKERYDLIIFYTTYCNALNIIPGLYIDDLVKIISDSENGTGCDQILDPILPNGLPCMTVGALFGPF